MKPICPLALLRAAVGLALLPLAVHLTAADSAATSQPTGTISGRVKNVATNQYLNKAQVSVKGTDFVALTDEFGSYRLVNLPAGSVTLQVFYTDLDVQEVRLELPAGGDLERDFDLTSLARYGSNATVRLDP